MSTPGGGRFRPFEWDRSADREPEPGERVEPRTYPVPAPPPPPPLSAPNPAEASRGPRDEVSWGDPASWAPQVPAGQPSVVQVTDAAAAVVDDVVTGVRGPAAVGHALTLVIDAAMLAGLVPAWLDLPATLAAVLSIGALLVSAGSRIYAVWQTLARARAHQATVTAPTVAIGRHQRTGE